MNSNTNNMNNINKLNKEIYNLKDLSKYIYKNFLKDINIVLCDACAKNKGQIPYKMLANIIHDSKEIFL